MENQIRTVAFAKETWRDIYEPTTLKWLHVRKERTGFVQFIAITTLAVSDATSNRKSEYVIPQDLSYVQIPAVDVSDLNFFPLLGCCYLVY